MTLDDNARKILFAAAKKQAQVEQRALEVFSQLLKIPQFMEWMRRHIVIRDEIDNEKKEIVTYVIYQDEVGHQEVSSEPSNELSNEGTGRGEGTPS